MLLHTLYILQGALIIIYFIKYRGTMNSKFIYVSISLILLLGTTLFQTCKSQEIIPWTTYSQQRAAIWAAATLDIMHTSKLPLSLSASIATLFPAVWDLSKKNYSQLSTIPEDWQIYHNAYLAPSKNQFTDYYKCTGLLWLTLGSLGCTHLSSEKFISYATFTGISCAALLTAQTIRAFVKNENHFEWQRIYKPLFISAGASALLTSFSYLRYINCSDWRYSLISLRRY